VILLNLECLPLFGLGNPLENGLRLGMASEVLLENGFVLVLVLASESFMSYS